MVSGLADTKAMLLATGDVNAKASDLLEDAPVTVACNVSLVRVEPQPPVSLKMNVAEPVVVVADAGDTVAFPDVTHADVTPMLTDAPAAAPVTPTVSVVCP
jgi:hypothetical protein